MLWGSSQEPRLIFFGAPGGSTPHQRPKLNISSEGPFARQMHLEKLEMASAS